MKIPNADHAVISTRKLRDYLLNPTHRRGAAKARLFINCGYHADEWAVLERDIRAQHLTQDANAINETDYGRRYEIIAPLITPCGRHVRFVTIWQIDVGTDVPRLITMYPR